MRDVALCQPFRKGQARKHTQHGHAHDECRSYSSGVSPVSQWSRSPGRQPTKADSCARVCRLPLDSQYRATEGSGSRAATERHAEGVEGLFLLASICPPPPRVARMPGFCGLVLRVIWLVCPEPSFVIHGFAFGSSNISRTLQFCERGDLDHCIGTMSPAARAEAARALLEALHHIFEQTNPPVIHRDIKVERAGRAYASVLWSYARQGEHHSQRTRMLSPDPPRRPSPPSSPFGSFNLQPMHIHCGERTNADGASERLPQCLFSGVHARASGNPLPWPPLAVGGLL